MKIKKANLFLKNNFFFLIAINFVLIIGLIFFLEAVDELQIIEKKAAEPQNISMEMPVLVLSFFPLDSNGNLDSSVVGLSSSLDEIRVKTNNLTSDISLNLTIGSIYHGYKERTATPSLHYSVSEEKEFLESMPVSNFETNNDGWFRPDYKKILEDINICDYVDNKGIKEIWIWGYHYNGVEPFERVMSMGYKVKRWWGSKDYGDATNFSNRQNLPICNNSYSLFNYNYARGLGEAIEDHTHYLEDLFYFIDPNLFVGKFIGGKYIPIPQNPEFYRCGWTHCPPNAIETCMRDQYVWDSERTVLSDCEDWTPDGIGEKQLVNCHNWAGENCESHQESSLNSEGLAFKSWWMQNMPGMDNKLYFENKKIINWWNYIGDFDGSLIKYNKTFYSDMPENSYFTYYKGDQKAEILTNYSTSWGAGNRQKFTVPTAFKNHEIESVIINLSYENGNEFVGMLSDEAASYASRKETVKRVNGTLEVWLRFDFENYKVEPGKTYIFWLKKKNQNKAYWITNLGNSEDKTIRNFQVIYNYIPGGVSPTPTLAPVSIGTPTPILTPTNTPVPTPTIALTPTPTTTPVESQCPLVCPTITSVSSGDGCFIKLSWDGVENATSYRIYRNSNPQSTNPYFKETTSTEYVWNWLPCQNSSLYSVSAVAFNCPIKTCTAVGIRTP